MAIKAGEIRYFLGLDTKTFLKAVDQANASVEKARRGAETPFRFREQGSAELLAKLAKITLAVTAIQRLTGTFREFETGIANIATLGVQNIGELQEGILQLGAETPIALNDLTAGLYQVVSAGVDSANQLQVLETSAKAAKAGLAQTTDALELAASVVKSYGLAWEDTEEILDKAFQTVNLGTTTFPELAKEMGKVTPIFAALKISTDELFGAFAALTGVTGDTSIVATQLRSIAADIAEPTDAMAAAIERAGFATSELFIQAEGLAGLMKLLQEETGGSAAEMTKFFGRIEAVNAALALSGEQFDDFVEKTEAMQEAAGSLNKAFEIQSKTLDSQIQVLQNNFEILTIGLLSGLVPALNVVVGTFADLIKAFINLEPWAKNTVIGIVALTAALLKGRAAVIAIRNSILLLQASLGPVGLITLAISAAATALVFFAGQSEDAQESLQDLQGEFDRSDQSGFRKEVSDTTRVLKALTDESDKVNYQRIIREQFLLRGQIGTLTVGTEEYSNALLRRRELETLLETEKNTARIREYTAELEELRKKTGVLTAGTEEYNNALVKYNQLEIERQTIRSRANILQETETQITGLETLTEKEIVELDKRKDYEFETQRISLAQYIQYLQTRREMLVAELGKDNLEVLKFQDKLDKLRFQLKIEIAADALKIPEQLDIRQPEALVISREIEQLEQEFTLRRSLVETRIRDAQTTAGEESEIYRRAVEERIQLEEEYQQRRAELNSRQAEILRAEFDQVIVFQSLNVEQLEQEFNVRRNFAELRIQQLRQTVGEENKIYKQAVEERVKLEEAFQQRKFELSARQVIDVDFQAQTFDQLQAEFDQRQFYAQLYIELAEETFTRESEAYENAVAARIQMERNFQSAKTRLALQGVQATLNISADLMNAAQGQSQFLFEIGKLASTSTAIINTYEAATKALAAYPPPFNFAAMAAVLAAGFAQVARITAVNFAPPAVPGFKEGSRGPLTEADVLQSFFTPRGEHGIVGVRLGETIINEQGSREFPNLLRAINEQRLEIPDIPGFQAGGIVGGAAGSAGRISGGSSPTLPGSLAAITKEDLDRMVEAISDVQINIRAELDAQEFYKETFPNYERNRRKRRQI